MYRANYNINGGISLAEDFVCDDFDELLEDIQIEAEGNMRVGTNGIITIWEEGGESKQYESKWEEGYGYVWEEKSNL